MGAKPDAAWGGRKASLLPLLAAIAVFIALFLAWHLFFKPKTPQQEGSIEIFLEGRGPFFSNSSRLAKAFSSCGAFSLYLDGKKIAEGESRAEAEIYPSAGSHTLLAKSASCASALNFTVVERQCEGNGTEACFSDGCEGIRRCFEGIYTECVLPRKVCVPKEKIGCVLDGCRFGYAECNPCGSGFGKCLPPENVSQQEGCKGGDCD
ncbi:MAG: hypothetical protein N3E51_04160 [Candidatus Micrarchaeota archaeon]|nr:hypothetical protein [Candidatus Micrarchaeota archaeon]